ncbi:MAG: cytochrome c [Nitrococcus sp.]|nr:cytochrome c [Nitrococcus sp.]
MKRRLVFSLGLLSCLLFSVQAFAIQYGDPKAGAEKFQDKGCVNCHREGGHSTVPTFPILAGQPSDYLVHALKQYKEGKRENPIMQGQASGLSESDIYDIAEYLSQQSTSLAIVPGIE